MKPKLVIAVLFTFTVFSLKAQIPDLDWAKRWGVTGLDAGRSTTVDAGGNIYATGYFEATIDFDSGPGIYNMTSFGGQDIFVFKLSASGDLIWVKQMGGATQDFANSIVVDANGNVYITGGFTGTADFDPGPGIYNLTSAGVHRNNYTVKLDALGNFIWAKQIEGPEDDLSNSIAVDANGNVYTTGLFQGTADFDPGAGNYYLTASDRGSDVFVSKLDATGNFIWAKQMGGELSDKGVSIAVDANGNVYTTGSFMQTADFDPGAGVYNLTFTDFDLCWYIFVSKLDAFGNFIWAKQLGTQGCESGYSIAVDANGNVYTTGLFAGTGDFDPGPGIYNLTAAGSGDVFVSKLNAAGDLVWAKQFGSAAYDFSLSLALDANGNVYTTGVFRGTADFDPGPGIYDLTPAGNSAAFVSKLDASGVFQWALLLDGAITPFSIKIAGGNVYITGNFYDTGDFDPGTGTYNMSSAGSEDIFLVTLKEVCTTPPVVALGDDAALCMDSTLILDAGQGNMFYLWNDGSTSSTLSVNDTGTYWVKVTDILGCIGADTIQITRIIPRPKDFLPQDNYICKDSGKVLRSVTDFSTYLWSNNATSGSIVINQPGIYWLIVTDQYGCSGKDSITITLEQCLRGFYVPNAFTPNNDGINDTFKPHLFGEVQHYFLAIFNRWGQMVFQTSDKNKGWDGQLSGKQQKNNVFVWMCRYQFKDESSKLEKGTVTLIR